MSRTIVLTGDRPTGKMHLGHYVGSLKNRFEMQDEFQCFFMIADYQALTTHRDRTEDLERHVREMVLDYLAAGFDPKKSVCFLQSQVPQLAELTMIFSNLVTLPRLLRNPTVKEEMGKMGLGNRVPYGFVGYPVSQAADILLFRPRYVPVGPDQRPHIELAQDVAARFNRIYGEVFPLPDGVYGTRLKGTDGQSKMGKSYGNAIDLSDEDTSVRAKVMNMVTDPGRVRATDPGNPDVCSAFHYREVFDEENAEQVARACRSGTIGCTTCKGELADVLNDFMTPFRIRRKGFEEQPDLVRDILNLGGSRARIEGQRTLEHVKEVMGMGYDALMG
ncbi:MAG: tryptophan--tRNA ligase [Gemmatimonadetes bacterium]|nr:tryptophan--tRNA ligase [Gemmatimonadota bacterium]